jgi:23S rRNA G2069 N7-methylase RlmK/C1962 C5-methylase RlmI
MMPSEHEAQDIVVEVGMEAARRARAAKDTTAEGLTKFLRQVVAEHPHSNALTIDEYGDIIYESGDISLVWEFHELWLSEDFDAPEADSSITGIPDDEE